MILGAIEDCKKAWVRMKKMKKTKKVLKWRGFSKKYKCLGGNGDLYVEMERFSK